MKYRDEIIVWAVTVALRLVVFVVLVFFPFWAPDAPPLIPILGSDSNSYLSAAEDLIQTGRFLNKFGEPNSYELPGYPLFLAGINALSPTPLAIPLIQNVIAGFSAVLLFHIGLLFSKKVAWGAIILFIFDPAGIFYTNTILTEPLFIFFLLLAFWIVTAHAARALPIFISGVTLGITTMVRPVGEILVPAFLLIIGTQTWPARKLIVARALLFCAGFFLIVGPWLVRNKIIFDRFELSAVASLQFAYAHAPLFYAHLHGLSDREAIKIFDERVLAASPYKDDVRRGYTGTLRNAPYMWQVARETIMAHPLRYAIFHISKTAPFFVSDGLREIGQRIKLITKPLASLGDFILKGNLKGFTDAISQSRIIFLFFIAGFSSWAIITLAMFSGMLFGILREERTKKVILIANFLIVIVMALVAGGAVAHPRYRFSVSPFIFLLASYGFFAALDKMKERR